MPAVPPVPCPVRLGIVKTGGLAAQLHQFTRERNVHKIEKLLKKGVDVDSVNSFGQTPLFCASLLGFTGVAELLLQHGADPNHRCDDRSTPVHAAVFSSNPWLLSELLDAGGDLRLHDNQGRTPRDWAEIGAQEHSARMLDFLKTCASHTRSLSQIGSARKAGLTRTSCKTLLRSPSLLDLLRPGGSDLIVNRKAGTKSSLCDTVQCFGFGKLCVEETVGLLASVPFISDSELSQAEDEALLSFSCGSYIQMTNYSWRGSRVTVKELHREKRHIYQDLLITELQYCCRLFHPHLLQLMAVSMPSDLEQSRLVYERLHVGSLYTLLYHKHAEFPFLQMCELSPMVLQVCEALLYLHGRSLVLRSLSSHSVVVVHPGVAKITNLGFITPSEGSRRCSGSPSLPAMMYNWAAPEVIRRKACTGKADLYSICALIQELYTGEVPWGSVDPHWIKQAVDAGQALSADPGVPQPFYDLLLKGLNPRPQDRTCSLQDLRYTLRSHLRELRRDAVRPLLVESRIKRRSTELKVHEQPDQQITLQEVQDELQHLDSCLESQSEEESSLRNLQSGTATQELPLHEWRPSPCASTHKEQGEQVDRQYLATQDSISDHIRSIVLNLKVSHVLIQQAESSLEIAESRSTRYTLPNCPVFDEVDGVETKVEVLKAVGPPSTYRPCLESQEEEEEVSGFCSAEDESFDRTEKSRMMSGGRQQGVSEQCVRSHWRETQECTDHRAEPTWTGEVRAAVARMARGLLGSVAGLSLSSGDSEDSRDKQERESPTMDTQKDAELERLFRSFAAVQSESEESTHFHTISLPGGVFELKTRREDSSESDYAQSPVEPSSIFYTPAHHLGNTHSTEESSQTLSSEEDLDVTMEVCRPNATVQSSYRECQPAPEEPEQTGSESVPRSTHTTSHVADIAELSSITCSPAQHLEWAGPDGAPPSPHSTRFPPCNSTPRSPGHGRGHSAPQREVPHMQSLIETSPRGSVTSRSCTDAYDTVRQEVTHTRNEESDTPTTGNPEFTTASSGVRHGTESSSTHSATGRAERVREHGEEDENENETTKVLEKQNCALCSSDEAPGDASSTPMAVREEEDDEMDEEECREPADTQQHAERASDPEPQQGSSNTPESLEETKRAHSTLDEVLQGLQDRAEPKKPSERPQTVIEDETEFRKLEEEEVEVRKEECRCPAGDHSDGAVWKQTSGDANEGAKRNVLNQPHRVIVLEQTATETQREPETSVTLEPNSQV